MDFLKFTETYTHGQVVVLAALSALLHHDPEAETKADGKQKNWRPPAKKPPKSFKDMPAHEALAWMESQR